MLKVIYKSRLCNSIEKEVNSLQKQLLDIVEIITPTDRWESVRSKVLRLTNDTRRNICANIEDNYEIDSLVKQEYDEVIKVKQQKQVSDKEQKYGTGNFYELGQLESTHSLKVKDKN